MSLIEDAKALVGMAPDPMGPYPCGVCGEYPVTDFVDGHMVRCRIDHAPTCPWLAMPRIVQALEAAQQLLDYLDIPGAEYDAKYGKDDEWWTDLADKSFVQKIRKAMRDAP